MDSVSSGASEIQFSSIIKKLCSPRHLKVYEDKLFVVEAGVGPQVFDETSDLCLVSLLPNDTSKLCFGRTGQVSVFHLDGSTAGEPPLTGLISGRSPDVNTNQVYGASAVDFDEKGTMFTLVGLGFVDAKELEKRDLVFASVLQGNEVVAKLWVPLHENNYANVSVVETNPFHLFIHNRITYVVDAGADLLYMYRDIETAGTAEPDSVIVLPKIVKIPALEPVRGGPCSNVDPPDGPQYCGQYQDNQGNWLYSTGAVPTAVRVNPSQPNRLYVAYLADTIWNEPVSGIIYWDLVDGIPQNDTMKEIEGAFYAIVDFGFYKDDIFVLETNPEGFGIPFEGRLSKVTFHSDGNSTVHVITVDDLFKPVGMLIHEDTLFVTNNTFNKGMDDCNGQILRANLSY